MKKIALITGITGQDGSYLTEFLLNKGYEVHGIIRRASSFNTQRIDHIFDNCNLKLHFGDMTDALAIDGLIKNLQPDEVYHLAAQSHVKVSFELPEYTAKVDAIGTLNVLEAIRKHSPKSRLYNACTSELFGKAQEIPQKETTRFYPRSPYGCFPSKTKILIKSKQLRYGKLVDVATSTNIEDIKIGNYVLSFNENTHKKEYDKVIDTMQRITNKTYLIKFSNGNEIECTEEHPFYLSDKIWVEAKDLTIGDKCIQYIYSGLNQRLFNLNKRGKSYEDIYGIEKSKDIKRKKEINPIKNNPDATQYVYMNGEKVYKRGKSIKYLYGEERAKEMAQKSSIKQKGKKKPLVSIAKKGKPSWNKGIKWVDIYTPEKIEILRKEKFGENSPSKNPLVREKISNTVKNLWNDVEYVKKQVNARGKKNKLEIAFEELLNEILPGEFIYNGRLEQNILINKKIPDYININGKKKVIELFGTYWHTMINKISADDLIKHYKQAGYDCLIIWDSELKNYDALKEKIENFYFNPKTELVTIIDIIEKEKKQIVYNFTTEKNNNYFAFGILVHNCAKLYSYWILTNYVESYGIFAVNGILFNHESERRGETFVTRKITIGLSKLSNNYQVVQNKKQIIPPVYLGNMYSKRDWGYAPDYVEAMWMMLQQEKPNNYVIATGETHTIKEFIDEAIKYTPFENKCKWIGEGVDEKLIYDNEVSLIKVDSKYYRPAEVEHLVGDAYKAKTELKWKPSVTFHELVRKMMQHDLENFNK